MLDRRWRQTAEQLENCEDNFLVDALRKNQVAIKNNSALDYREVMAVLPGYSSPTIQAILLVNDHRFNLQNLDEQDCDDPTWSFNDLDLRGFVFSGNLYRRSHFYNTDLTNADLSGMTIDKIHFDHLTKLAGVKFPANIFQKGVLNQESKQCVINQLKKTYSINANRGMSFHNLTMFTRSNVVQDLKTRARNNDNGASANTLKVHGIKFS